MNHQKLLHAGFSMLLCISMHAAPARSVQDESKAASAATIAAQTAMRASLPADDGRDAEFAHRGFIATGKERQIRDDKGMVVWDLDVFKWIQGDVPPTVSPSLWRHMKLLRENGLYKVADGVYQVRGYDASNMTVVAGRTGWVVVDPLWSQETARAALALVNEHLGPRPVSAVVYTHSHPDHFGGVRGIVDSAAPPPIIAPEHFMKETSSEWVMAGNATGRRATFQIGSALGLNALESVGAGLSAKPSLGLITLIPPSDYIRTTGETRVIDGVTFEFQMVPETEAPSEMNLFLPEQRTLFISEIATCTLHNVQTPRGALVRDALRWAGFLTEALERYGERSDAIMQGHCWPRFGNEVVKNYLALQRDNYKFIHDQTVRRFNNGETPAEIADQLKPPPAIGNEWSNRGYYGTVRHNAKGVYQRYIGWWDGIPAHLNLHPPVEQGKRYVAAMGGAARVIATARRAMSDGDYRWAAELLNHAVFADPGNKAARNLLADSYEQMGYQAESAVWRNIYLTGAAELRHGVSTRLFLSTPSPDLVGSMSTATFLDLLATRLNPATIGDRTLTMAIEVSDTGENMSVSVRNAVLVAQAGKTSAAPDVSLRASRAMLMGLFLKKLPLQKLEAAGLVVSGNRAALVALQQAIDTPPADYAIVTP